MAREEVDFDYRNTAEQDKNLAVKFFSDVLQNDDKTAKEGRPIYDDVVMIEKRVRGDRNNIVIRPARPDDFRRFRQAYEDFKSGEEATKSGTPLSAWGGVGRGLAEELKFLGFHTVEQLAEASDSVCAKMAGLQNLKQKARAYIEIAKGNTAPLEDMAKKLGELLNQNEVLQRQNAKLAERLTALEAQVD
jgi:molybdopterin biosynthesis enzyme